MKQRWLLSIVVGLLLSLSVSISPAWAQTGDAIEIDATGADGVRLGMTLAELEASIAPDLDVSDEVEVSPGQMGHIVTRGGAVWAIVTIAEGVVDMIILVDAVFTTAEGIGPGSTIDAAEAAYGNATMTWFPDEQGQEIATFASGPESLQLFTSDSGGPRAGIYGDDQTTTVVIKPDAVITTIRVMCSASPCVYDSPEPVEDDPAEPEDDPAEPEDDPAEDEPAEDEPVDDQPAEDEPVDDDPAEPEPVEDDPAEPEDEPVEDELASTGTASDFTAGLGFLLVGSGCLAFAAARRLVISASDLECAA